jgi:GAF domain-containing protein
MPAGTVLHVDPEREACREVRAALDETGLQVRSETTVAAATDVLRSADVECLVAEHELDDGTGLDLVERVRETDPDLGCILYTDAARETVAAAIDDPLVAEYVPKDASAGPERVSQLVRTTVDHRSQTAYPLPDREADRLALLEDLELGDGRLEAALERVARLATTHFDLPVASVSHVGEDTKEFLVCEGADWAGLDREATVCTFTILDDGVTVVDDLAADPRFVANETLDELGIRFYAGATLRLADGLPVGTLCVYDESPRAFSGDEEAYLELLADEASHWIECYALGNASGADSGERRDR